MAKKEKNSSFFREAFVTVVKAFADKGTPAIFLLFLIVVAIWLPVEFFIDFSFKYFINSATSQNTTTWYVLLIFLIPLGALAACACFLTYMILKSIGPTLKAEAEAQALLSQAFGGRVSTSTGHMAIKQLPRETAKRRISQIMKTLIRRAIDELSVDQAQVRANIFKAKNETWLNIANGFHENMKVEAPNKDELKIEILNGHLSTGTAYKYSLPILSIKKAGGNWSHMPAYEDLAHHHLNIQKEDFEKLKTELDKAHPNLKWIISMPIPFQVQPFKIVCGVINLDGLSSTPHRDQLINLLADVAVAAALIGVINRSTDILESQCHRIDKDLSVESIKEKCLVLEEEYQIPPDEFDPADCPEPTEKFKDALGKIRGMEFFKKISTTEVAEFLREQLYS